MDGPQIYFDENEKVVKNQGTCIKVALNDLSTQMSDLSDFRTESGDFVDEVAATLTAVRTVVVFARARWNPPKPLRELQSSLLSYASEVDRLALKSCPDMRSFTATISGKQTFKESVEELYRAFLVDRRLQRNDEGFKEILRGYADGLLDLCYGGAQATDEMVRAPCNVCTICFKKGCQSSKHRKEGKTLFKKLARAYLTGQDDEDSDKKRNELDIETSLNEEEDVLQKETESYISYVLAAGAMGVTQKKITWVIEESLIDTGSSVLSSVGLFLLPAAKISHMRTMKPMLNKNQIQF